MRTRIILLTVTTVFVSHFICAQWRNTYTHQNQNDHNHFSIETLGGDDGDFVVAGTIFDPQGTLTDTKVQIMRLNANGNIVWEQSYDLGDDQRCFDITVGEDNTLALTGYVEYQGKLAQTYILIVDASDGSYVNYSEYSLQNLGSTGLHIIYSEESSSYYVAGYEAENIKDLMSDKSGYVLSADASTLNPNWKESIAGIASYSNVNMANKLTEIPEIGVFVTGSVNHDPPPSEISFASTLRVLFDYNGGVIWDLTAYGTNNYECGADAVYSRDDDVLYVLSNNSVSHTFEIQKIENASSSGASTATSYVNDLFGDMNNINTAGFSLELVTTEDEPYFIVGGMHREMYFNNLLTDNSPSFIARVNSQSFDVEWLRYIETYNLGYRNHDHDIFRAFFVQQPHIHYPEILKSSGNNYYLLGYALDASYELTISKTNDQGYTDDVNKCEVSLSSESMISTWTYTDIDIFQTNVIQTKDVRDPHRTPHLIADGCTPFYSDRSMSEQDYIHYKGFINKSLQVYPNPNDGTFSMDLEISEEMAKGNVSIYMMNTSGQKQLELLKEQTVTPGVFHREFNELNLPSGQYIIAVQTATEVIYKTIIINR